jgi:uncharacterized membrane protein YphA (DoxX/SURF4 family)
MANRNFASNLGACVFGGATIFLGVIGLVSSDFATNWQRVEPTIPHRALLAYLAAICEIAGGAAILWQRTARAGAALLTILYAIYVFLWVQMIVRAPFTYDSWGNFFEESSLLIASLIVFASASPAGSAWVRSEPIISRVYGFCVISYALEHFIYLRGAAGFVPAWIPPGQMFWAVTTAICFLAAAAAIFSGVLSGLATRLLTAEIIGFELLIWGPRLVASPRDHFVWSGNGINCALIGAAWVIADSIARQEKQRLGREASGAAAVETA